jgi:ferritin-like metal-binding protein YciE
MSERATDEVMDAALIAASQRIEHYEISATARGALRRALGHNEAADLLRQSWKKSN